MIGLAAMGCPSFSTLQTPRTVPKGKVREAIGVEIVRLRTNDGSRYTVPLVEVGGRYGVSDRVDIGGKFSYAFFLLSAEAGLKVQLVRGPLDIAVAPAFSFVTFGSSSSTSGSTGSNDVTFLHLHLPALMGIELSEIATLGFGPKLLYSSMSGNFAGDSRNLLVNGTFVGGFVSLPVEVAHGVWIAPEINFYTPVNAFGNRAEIQGGIAVMYGGHEFRPQPDSPPQIAPPTAAPPPNAPARF
jgi:hypothetical protein